MLRSILPVLPIILLSQTAPRDGGGLSDDVMRQALECGTSLVTVMIHAVRTGEERGTDCLYYKAGIKNVIIAGDLHPADLPDTVFLFAGMSDDKLLVPGETYALFVTRDAPRSFMWSHRNVRLSARDAQQIGRIGMRARLLYAGTRVCEFRESEFEDVSEPSTLSPELKTACAGFRSRSGNRCEPAEVIGKSEIGTLLDDSKPFLSIRLYLPPRRQLSRPQILRLLGPPDVRAGYTYKWFCGRDTQDRAGVLNIHFTPKNGVRTLRYCHEPLDYWVEE